MKWLCVFMLAAAALAATVTHPANGVGQPTTSDTGEKVYTYTVKPEKNADGSLELIKDFHLWYINPDSNKKKKLKGTGGGGPANWTKNKANDGHNRGGSTALGSAGAQFTITLPKDDKFNDRMLQWEATADGDLNPGDDLDHGPGFDKNGSADAAIHGPIVSADIAVGVPDELGPGVCIINIETTERNAPYRVFAVSENPSGPAVPDPLVDYNGFVTWCDAHGAPAQLIFAGMTGITDADGNSAAPRVTVPVDPALRGETFFVIVVVENEGDHCAGGEFEMTIRDE